MGPSMLRLALQVIVKKGINVSILSKFLVACFFISGTVLAEDQASYLLGANDQIEVRVFREADLSTLARIQADNSILLPVVGTVIVGGLSEQDAVARIQQALISGGVVQDPAVTIRIVEYASKRIAVLGYAMSPGSYYLDRPSTISDILAKAGGAQVEGADFLYYTDYDPKTAQSQKHTLNIQELLGAGDSNLDKPVGDGDIIFIPKAPVFYIYGQVRQPGVYRLYPGMTAEQALATAGGVSEMGKASKLRKRDSKSGKMVSVGLEETIAASEVFFIPERIF